jgi:FAD synthetase
MGQIPRSQLEKSRANGSAKQPSQPRGSPSLPDVCDELRHKVTAFLEEKTDDKRIRNVQSRVRVSMGVIEEALSRYGCVTSH